MTASSLIAVVFRKVLPLTRKLSDSEDLIVLDSSQQKTPLLPFLQFQNSNWLNLELGTLFSLGNWSTV